MPQYRTPGVYVEELHGRSPPITGVSTSTVAFIGLTRRGPFAVARTPRALSSFAEFERVYGGLAVLSLTPKTNFVAHAARVFFDEGGRKLVIARVKPATRWRSPTIADWQDALDALARLPEVSIVAAPGSTEQGQLAGEIQTRLLAHAESSQAYRFAVLDVPQGKTPLEALDYRKNFDSQAAAIYYPWVSVAPAAAVSGPTASPAASVFPPSGFVCGIYVRTDLERGVFKPPANEIIRSAVGLERQFNIANQETLNSGGVNCLRHFPGRGYRVWGARTLSADPEWKYVNVRRYLTYLEQSIVQGTPWVAFEPNAANLWAKVKSVVSDFLHSEWTAGALAGDMPQHAFFVRCDPTTMTQDDLSAGRLICQIGVAVVRPSEFAILRFTWMTHCES